MKDSIEYLCIVVIACAAGYWLMNQWIAEPFMGLVYQTATIIAEAAEYGN